MGNTIISIILIFNIVLMLLYFIVKINQRAINRAKDTYEKKIREQKELIITDEDHRWIDSFIADSSIPENLKTRPSFTLEISNLQIQYVNIGKIDKNSDGFGVIIRSVTANQSVNLIPVSFLENTRKGSLYVQNNERNLVGLFTPFYIVIFNTLNLEFSQSAESDEVEETEDIPMTSYTKENKAKEHLVVKVKLPFFRPAEFAAQYYQREFKDYMKSRQ